MAATDIVKFSDVTAPYVGLGLYAKGSNVTRMVATYGRRTVTLVLGVHLMHVSIQRESSITFACNVVRLVSITSGVCAFFTLQSRHDRRPELTVSTSIRRAFILSVVDCM